VGYVLDTKEGVQQDVICTSQKLINMGTLKRTGSAVSRPQKQCLGLAGVQGRLIEGITQKALETSCNRMNKAPCPSKMFIF
jgi:hypothetical protein